MLVSHISMKFTKFKSPLNKNIAVYTMTVQTEKQRYYFVPTKLKDKSREKAEHNSSKRRAGDKNRRESKNIQKRVAQARSYEERDRE